MKHGTFLDMVEGGTCDRVQYGIKGGTMSEDWVMSNGGT